MKGAIAALGTAKGTSKKHTVAPRDTVAIILKRKALAAKRSVLAAKKSISDAKQLLVTQLADAHKKLQYAQEELKDYSKIEGELQEELCNAHQELMEKKSKLAQFHYHSGMWIENCWRQVYFKY